MNETREITPEERQILLSWYRKQRERCEPRRDAILVEIKDLDLIQRTAKHYSCSRSLDLSPALMGAKHALHACNSDIQGLSHKIWKLSGEEAYEADWVEQSIIQLHSHNPLEPGTLPCEPKGFVETEQSEESLLIKLFGVFGVKKGP